ncbi:hypothetical protein [Kribbella sp. CA-293567]|uniref:hypothetical protein n=1 Tax=Kribbella sp. CA-293567 TaxID=3002436 RepID=UPI0022DE6AED|nr:hypothetical protein [Kribbella sp. CA-293567]WBQ08400.1 hypothetical protein OX958_16665 [Kribbella sp. CA-293567]
MGELPAGVAVAEGAFFAERGRQSAAQTSISTTFRGDWEADAVLSQLVQTLLATLHARYSDHHQLFTSDTPASLQRHERVVEVIAARGSKAAEAAATALVRASRVEVLGPEEQR